MNSVMLFTHTVKISKVNNWLYWFLKAAAPANGYHKNHLDLYDYSYDESTVARIVSYIIWRLRLPYFILLYNE